MCIIRTSFSETHLGQNCAYPISGIVLKCQTHQRLVKYHRGTYSYRLYKVRYCRSIVHISYQVAVM